MNADLGRIALTTLVVVSIGGVPLAAAQDTFQAEGGLSYSRFSAEGSRQNTASVEGAYFFDKLPVSPKDHPVDQAAFVGRIGSVSANYGRSDWDVDGYQTLDNGSMYGVTIDFRQPDTPFIVRASYDSFYSAKLGGTQLSSATTFETYSDTKYYQLSLGGYVAKTTALSLDWAKFRTRFRVTQSDGAVPVDDKESFSSIGFSGQHLSQLSSSTYIATIASVGQTTREPESAPSEKNREWSLQATYYPAKTLGLMLGVSSSRGDDASSEGETYLAGMKMFVTPSVSFGLDFQQSHAKSRNSLDFDYVTLTALVRF